MPKLGYLRNAKVANKINPLDATYHLTEPWDHFYLKQTKKFIGKLGLKEFFNLIKGMHQKLIPKIIINGETTELFPLEQGK